MILRHVPTTTIFPFLGVENFKTFFKTFFSCESRPSFLKLLTNQPVWEGEVGAGAHRDCIALLALARDLAGEGRALDVLVRELGRHLKIWVDIVVCQAKSISTAHYMVTHLVGKISL